MSPRKLNRLKSNLPAIFRKHSVAVAYLFGSHAEGVEDALSDLDLAVLYSKPPENRDWLERWQGLVDEIEPLISPTKLDLVFLQRAPILLQWQAISKGKVLYSADERFRLDFEEQVIGEWLDFSEWLKEFHRDMVTGIVMGSKAGRMEKIMLDGNVLLTQLSFVQQAHTRIRRLAQLSEADFLANEDNIDVAQNRLRLAAEASADMGRHIIARMGWGTPTSSPDVFTQLGLHGVLSSSLVAQMRTLVSFRNTLVHRYPLVAPQELYQRVRGNVAPIGGFIQEITQYLQEQGVC
jgi:uncharacterized protein